MEMLSHTELRKGVKVDVDGEPYLIIDSDFVKPGKGTAFTRVRIRSFLSGRTIERTFKSSETVPRADVEERPCQFLYSDGEASHFMDTQTYEQFHIHNEALGDTGQWLQENMDCRVLMWKGRPISCDPPNFVELEITYCEPGVRGDTASGTSKPATLSTGATVQVPLFVNQGDWIKIDTRTATYIERVKK
jgi:elongation factor P